MGVVLDLSAAVSYSGSTLPLLAVNTTAIPGHVSKRLAASISEIAILR
jgi:hypothetical protein